MSREYSEVLHLNDGGHLMVTVVETYVTGDNLNFFDDRMVVKYKETEYVLKWDDYDSVYEGKVDGKLGYIH